MKEEILKLKAKIDQEANVMFGERFLQLTGLKVGDVVNCSFNYSYGDSRKSFGAAKVCEGVIKQYESGALYVECIDKLTQSYNTSNNRSGRDRRSWWVHEEKITKATLMDIQFTQAGGV